MGVAVTSLPGPRCRVRPPPTQAVSWAQGVVGSWLREPLGPYLVSDRRGQLHCPHGWPEQTAGSGGPWGAGPGDRKSTRLNSSH